MSSNNSASHYPTVQQHDHEEDHHHPLENVGDARLLNHDLLSQHQQGQQHTSSTNDDFSEEQVSDSHPILPNNNNTTTSETRQQPNQDSINNNNNRGVTAGYLASIQLDGRNILDLLNRFRNNNNQFTLSGRLTTQQTPTTTNNPTTDTNTIDPNNNNSITPPQQNNANQRSIRINLHDLSLFTFRVLPMVVLPFMVLMYWHYIGVLLFIWLSTTSINSDIRIKEQVALKQARKIFVVIFQTILLLLSIGFIFLFFYKDKIWHLFYFTIPELDKGSVIDTFWDCLFYVFLIDSIIKLAGMIVKTIIVLILPPMLKQIHIGRILAVSEVLFQLYRISLPPNIWIRYLLNNYNQVFAIITIVIYAGFKLGSLLTILFELFISCKNLFSPTCPYGKRLSSSEVSELGEHHECSICLQNYERPVRLQCQHVFCEQCISEWVQTGNQTCPVCRTPVSQGGMPISSRYEKGGTALFCFI
ncbi:hypothetical protein FDP41_003461 [Naegleria fowleri]|uniref:RING-type domain-containing protein n=1 Tax=Naegleria fowleri TaxID=5763 RepID=A0A6A5BX18_NAEFO|nr:uncharacterized protein FDP41_003461 [Naegleria fowleri]KAF0977469.1 hypothetical protein FDP41_003461 [Naegleria fowleri]